MSRPALPWILACLLLMVVLLAVGLRVGSYETSYSLISRALLHYNPQDAAQLVLIELRLPRLLLALLAGAGLAVSGYLMQAMVNNSLADPYLLGTASGGALGASTVFTFFPALTITGLYLPPLAALLGALGTTLVVVIVGSRRGRIVPAQLLLAGVAVGSLTTSLGGLLTFLAATEEKLRTITFWALGGFDKASWAILPYPAVALGVGLLLLGFLHNSLNLLLLGEERATALGLPVARTRWLLLLIASGLTGCVVALAGPIGFVGLVVPHITRWLLGTVSRGNLVFCALLGGNFLLLCDLLARLLYPPAGLPVGLVTALFGVPFFVYLLRKQGS
ncbi:iron complex transport system permease protein [Hymenobacter luteus]|uniref:Iron complex transport system permease protein n=2 Tax=Hymenobacter TaxID=89966 RepID=A0A7W9SXF9_9BACT|nr:MULTISPECIES: iron ABC transporter permease [Hymenobacter]MBB4600510.1 iron complex transport system permease protein [Hymenobacter latericoloratus]MBB6057180.1 iron complex transport system permease protein [Hymenobacter luteus]